MVLTQTHPAAPYVCRTGNITLRCQYDGVENVFVVLWNIGGTTTSNLTAFPGHTALPHTATLSFQDLVVDSYTNLQLVAGYRCLPTITNGSQLQSNIFRPQLECECYLLVYKMRNRSLTNNLRLLVHNYYRCTCSLPHKL